VEELENNRKLQRALKTLLQQSNEHVFLTTQFHEKIINGVRSEYLMHLKRNGKYVLNIVFVYF
jgi:hypothetical protein